MEDVGATLLYLIYQLLPGFLAAWVFFGLTAYRKPSSFERLVQALIFTAIVKLLVLWTREVFAVGAKCHSFGPWTEDVAFGWSMIIAVVFGVGLAYLANRDAVHNRLWRVGITNGSSYPSEWYKTFACEKRFVILHLVDDRRIYGWPSDWPDHADQGHFVLTEAEWLVEDQRQPLSLTERVIIPVSRVEMVEMIVTQEEQEAMNKP